MGFALLWRTAILVRKTADPLWKSSGPSAENGLLRVEKRPDSVEK
jgi:hypothetical protein